MYQDPICGMQVDENKAIKITKDGKDYFFCSDHCKDKFIRQKGIKDAAVCLPSSRKLLFKNKLFIVISVSLLCIFASFFVTFLEPFRKIFFTYLRKIWWAVALGLFFGGIIDRYIPREYISKVLSRKGPGKIFNAVILGFLMSACSHGILALSIQLHKKGASNPAVISFLLASPWANFAVTLMLISFFGINGFLIMLAAIIIAINSGFIFIFLENKGLIEKNKNTVETKEDFSILKDIRLRMKSYNFGYKTLLSDIRGIYSGAIALGDMVLWWIILGIFLASLAGAYIPVHFFHNYMGPTLLGLGVTLALATIIEICSEGSSPLAFEIYRQTGALGNSFVFLMAGVATDYTEIGLLWHNVGRRSAIWLPIVTVPQVILLGHLANIFLR